MHHTLYTIHHTLYTIHYTLYTIHYTPYTIHHTLYTIHYTPYTIHYTLYTIHYTPYTIHYTPYTIHYTPYTIHYTLYTIHYTPYTIHYTLYTIHYILSDPHCIFLIIRSTIRFIQTWNLHTNPTHTVTHLSQYLWHPTLQNKPYSKIVLYKQKNFETNLHITNLLWHLFCNVISPKYWDWNVTKWVSFAHKL